MGQYLGPGLLGLGVTAMIAGFMSGMAGNVSAFATVWTYDVYKPLFRKNASDAHYLSMGRWCSILGVLISIGTAYALFWFSNILEFLQVLVFFFIVPLFGTVILGMLWKRATPAGGFWGFFAAILVSIGMWVFVHTFPEGYRPQPKVDPGRGQRGGARPGPADERDPARGGRERPRRRAERAGPGAERQRGRRGRGGARERDGPAGRRRRPRRHHAGAADRPAGPPRGRERARALRRRGRAGRAAAGRAARRHRDHEALRGRRLQPGPHRATSRARARPSRWPSTCTAAGGRSWCASW